MISLLAKQWKLAVILVLVGVVVFACHERDNALRAEGEARAKLAELVAKTRRDSLAERSANTVVERDTVVLQRWLTKYDTVRHTLNIHDTVQVVTYIETADSTIAACRQSLLDFSSLCAKKDTVIQDLRAQLAVVRVPVSASKSQRVLWGIGGLVAGALVDRALVRR